MAIITFFIALAVLIGGYLIYSRVSKKIFTIDNRKTPAIAKLLKKSISFFIIFTLHRYLFCLFIIARMYY